MGKVEYCIFNPGGNLTALVFDNNYSEEQRKVINDAILKKHKCVEQVGLINKQIEIVEKIVDEYVSCNNLNLSPCFIENVKTRVKNFLLEYRDNPNRYYVFYWSEYPMGAIHNKVLIKIDSIWHIVQDDYDKKPSEKRTPFPEINDENLVTYLVKFIIEEGR